MCAHTCAIIITDAVILRVPAWCPGRVQHLPFLRAIIQGSDICARWALCYCIGPMRCRKMSHVRCVITHVMLSLHGRIASRCNEARSLDRSSSFLSAKAVELYRKWAKKAHFSSRGRLHYFARFCDAILKTAGKSRLFSHTCNSFLNSPRLIAQEFISKSLQSCFQCVEVYTITKHWPYYGYSDRACASRYTYNGI